MDDAHTPYTAPLERSRVKQELTGIANPVSVATVEVPIYRTADPELQMVTDVRDPRAATIKSIEELTVTCPVANDVRVVVVMGVSAITANPITIISIEHIIVTRYFILPSKCEIREGNGYPSHM